jgi:lysozyme family protein
MTFDEAFDALIGHEGGYVNNPADPGGETKFGISKRSYPNEDIKNLTLDRAKTIYLRDYWKPAGCDAVVDAAKFDLFDMAVNSGVKPAVRTLQTAAGVTADGIIGPATLRAVSAMPGAQLVARFNGARLAYMAGLPTWATFGKGWARRIADNLMRA